MTVTENKSREKKKGKKPPTFQHLPRDRAAKLKKEWIEKAKVKKQWKAQKRKEDVVFPAPHRDLPPHQASEVRGANRVVDQKSEGTDAERESRVEEPKARSELNAREGAGDGERARKAKKARFAPESGPSVKKPRQAAAPRKSFKERMQKDSDKDGKDGTEGDEASKPSLRELTRTAYSPASLHNVKSNQRHRHLPPHMNGGTQQGKSGQRKGGQPNMRLRMEAMLEKIKRDHA